MPTLKPAASLSIEDLSALVTRCYEAYYVPVSFDAATYARMINAWNLDLERSRVVVADGRPVAIAMLGVRGTRGWIGGMGVVPEARGAGHGRAVMEAVLAEARGAGVTQVDLEVLVQNSPAFRIYEALGFRDTRPLDVWIRAAAPAPLPSAFRVDDLPVSEAFAAHAGLHPVRSPWQRDLRSLERLAGPLRALAVMQGGAITACAIYRADPGKLQIFDIGSAAGAPVDAIDAVLGAVLRVDPTSAAGLVNLAPDDPAARAFEALGFGVAHRQREMALVLQPARKRASLAGRFLDAEGRLTQWPTKRRDQTEALELMAAHFTPGQFYSEREVNEMLNRSHTFGDWALLRRALCDFGYLDRTGDGARYWRKETS